jgi:hypothetical protein
MVRHGRLLLLLLLLLLLMLLLLMLLHTSLTVRRGRALALPQNLTLLCCLPMQLCLGLLGTTIIVPTVHRLLLLLMLWLVLLLVLLAPWLLLWCQGRVGLLVVLLTPAQQITLVAFCCRMLLRSCFTELLLLLLQLLVLLVLLQLLLLLLLLQLLFLLLMLQRLLLQHLLLLACVRDGERNTGGSGKINLVRFE